MDPKVLTATVLLALTTMAPASVAQSCSGVVECEIEYAMTYTGDVAGHTFYGVGSACATYVGDVPEIQCIPGDTWCSDPSDATGCINDSIGPAASWVLWYLGRTQSYVSQACGSACP